MQLYQSIYDVTRAGVLRRSIMLFVLTPDLADDLWIYNLQLIL